MDFGKLAFALVRPGLILEMSNMGVFGKTVQIKNDFGANLGVHCKSKNNDLGSVTPPPGGEWGSAFRSNIWRTTLFYCDLWSDNGLATTLTVHDDKFLGYACDYCLWRVKPTFFCFCPDDVVKNRLCCSG
ncbi:hypothetical protein MLD38_036474 [Melastoma candidum]|uniref:Uncharacterized protein n=1 Tax=Melastoma candidum TaxID=119954 RepID=A0ACB9LJB5_9MYRT|nr:hypothetical protein MLD38_036474 [Melastoma candidum]